LIIKLITEINGSIYNIKVISCQMIVDIHIRRCHDHLFRLWDISQIRM